MPVKPKQLASPFITGGGGIFFESRVQASFVALMMAEGMCPGLDGCRIEKVSAQNRYRRVQTDDVLVEARHMISGHKVKLFGQIKHTLAIQKSKKFKAVIDDAWRDFTNPDLFNRDHDVIALITGPLSAKEGKEVRGLLERARQAGSAAVFYAQIKEARISSDGERKRLEVFKHALREAKGSKPSEAELFEFLRCFRLLGYDLDIQAGVTHALIQTVIGLASAYDANHVWNQILDQVQHSGAYAGEFIASELRPPLSGLMHRRSEAAMAPSGGWPDKTAGKKRGNVGRATVRIACGLVGQWNEQSPGDRELISSLTGMDFADWQERVRAVLADGGGGLEQQNGRWRCKDHSAYLTAYADQLTPEHLESFKPLVIAALQEVVEDASKVSVEYYFDPDRPQPRYSHGLREGLSETLAILSSRSGAFTTVPAKTVDRFAVEVVESLLIDTDQRSWAALNQFLPMFAEAAPRSFLKAVEEMAYGDNQIFPDLCAMEGDGLFGASRITGLLWALETTAWHKNYFSRSISCLSALAAKDTGGRFANRPGNSLATILLPWMPQTLASDKLRRVAVRNVVKDHPEVGWSLLLELLPEGRMTSNHSRKPQWRNWLPDGHEVRVSKEQYWADCALYSKLLVGLAGIDVERLVILIDRYAHLSPEARELLRVNLNSRKVSRMPEVKRQALWTALTKLSVLHRGTRSHYRWKLAEEELKLVDSVADHLKPTKVQVRHQRLFSGNAFALYDDRSFGSDDSLLARHRKEGIAEILEAGGIVLLKRFARSVEDSWQVGLSLAAVESFKDDRLIVPTLLSSRNEKLRKLAGGFARMRVLEQGWRWFDEQVPESTDSKTLAELLHFLPFQQEAWKRAEKLLGFRESRYWQIVSPHAYGNTKNFHVALNKLVDHGRADAALSCMASLVLGEKPLPVKTAVRALLELKDGSHVSNYELGRVIAAVQEARAVSKKNLVAVEWKFMSVLDGLSDVRPKVLSWSLAEDPQFFCMILGLVYRSKGEMRSGKEPTQQQRDLAMNGYRLLDEWRIPPGLKKDGSFSGSSFKKWLREVKQIATKSGHWEQALYEVGEIAYHTPRDKDTGVWPKAVCEELNRRGNERMRAGFKIEIYNSYGVHSAGGGSWYDARSQEWSTMAETVDEQGYSNLADALREIAEDYERDAERERQEEAFYN